MLTIHLTTHEAYPRYSLQGNRLEAFQPTVLQRTYNVMNASTFYI